VEDQVKEETSEQKLDPTELVAGFSTNTDGASKENNE